MIIYVLYRYIYHFLHIYIYGDLTWMHQQLAETSVLPDPTLNMGPWLDILRNHPSYWKRLVRRACQHAIQQRHLTQQVRDFHEQAFEILNRNGILDYTPPCSRDIHEEQHFGCLACGIRFWSFAGECVHMCRRHGQVAEHRFLFDGTQCPECQKEFHTHGRLSQHLRYAQRCQEALRGRGHYCHPAPGHGSTLHAQQKRLHNGTRVTQQGAGPQRQPHPPRAHRDIDMAFYDTIGTCLLDSPADNLMDALRIQAPKHDIPWTRFVATLRMFLDEDTETDAEICGISRDQLRGIVISLTTPSTWPMFQCHVQTPLPPRTLEDYEDWACTLCARARRRSIWTPFAPIPRAFTKDRVFLHFFSGRRRPGDIQFFLDQVAIEGVVLHVVSLDIIIDEHLGDLSQIETRKFWLGAMARGWVIAMLAGPPCNTWSRARAHQVPGGHRQPRPVRSGQQLWGLSCLSLRELRDVQMGNLFCASPSSLCSSSAFVEGQGSLSTQQNRRMKRCRAFGGLLWFNFFYNFLVSRDWECYRACMGRKVPSQRTCWCSICLLWSPTSINGGSPRNLRRLHQLGSKLRGDHMLRPNSKSTRRAFALALHRPLGAWLSQCPCSQIQRMLHTNPSLRNVQKWLELSSAITSEEISHSDPVDRIQAEAAVSYLYVPAGKKYIHTYTIQ